MANQSQRLAASATKAVKLRESCDCCLVAKVKCGKEKPVCKRCLTNGSYCLYSPCLKTGRRTHKNPSTKATNCAEESINVSTQTSELFASGVSPDDAHSLFESARSDLLENTQALFASGESSHIRTQNPFTERSNDMPTDRGGPDPKSKPQSPKLDIFTTTPNYLDPFIPMFDLENGIDFLAEKGLPNISRSQMTKDYANFEPFTGLEDHAKLSSPSVPPDSASHTTMSPLPISSSERGLYQQQKGQSCDCFAACLQMLKTLHNQSYLLLKAQPEEGPSFDVILNSNKEAIESCTAIVGCTKCVSACGNSVVTTMVATIIGKAISVYQAACSLMFSSSTGMQSTTPLAFGAYKVTGENRQLLEIEILLLDLKKVASVLMAYSDKFCNNSSAKDDEVSMFATLKSYLEKDLRMVVQYLNTQKNCVSK